MTEALHQLSASALLRAYAAHELSPVEVVRATLKHIGAWEPRLHATYALDPAGALVMAEEGQETSGRTVRLTKASKLKAPNSNSGVKGAFWGVQESELPIGTELKLVESVKDESGKVTYYVVEAPSTARGQLVLRRRCLDDAALGGLARQGRQRALDLAPDAAHRDPEHALDIAAYIGVESRVTIVARGGSLYRDRGGLALLRRRFLAERDPQRPGAIVARELRDSAA